MATSTPAPSRRPGVRCAFVGFSVAFVASGVLHGVRISQSTSSTAAIGYIFLPFVALFLSLPFALGGLCFGYLKERSDRGTLTPGFLTLASGTVVGALVLAVAATSVRGLYLSHQVDEALGADAAELRALFDSAVAGRSRYVLGAIAQNPKATPELLHSLATRTDPELHLPMGDLFFDLLGPNRKGLAVMRLVAAHPGVRPDTLEVLAQSPDEYVRGDVARNPALPERALRQLQARGGTLVDWGTAANPKAPADLLEQHARNGDHYTRVNVSQNPGTPAEVLRVLERDPEWDVRRGVATNPRTPTAVVEALSSDGDERVRRAAAQRLQSGR